MKKLSVVLVAVLAVLALSLPASAFENEFGGYFRTRYFTDQNFAGSDNIQQDALGRNVAPNTPGSHPYSQDLTTIDTRTRLYYTAKFSDNLKFINRFEFNANWGENGTYGQLGADSNTVGKAGISTLNGSYNYFRLKHSYVDFKLSDQDFRVGVQDFMLARGYLMNDDAAGVKAIFKVNDAVYLPLIYMKIFQDQNGYYSTGYDYDPATGWKLNNRFDVDAYIFYPSIYLNKDNVFRPHIATIQSDNFMKAYAKGTPLNPLQGQKLNLWSAGLEYDGKYDIYSFGATGVFEFGDLSNPGLYNEGKAANSPYYVDKLTFGGYLFDANGGVNIGPANVHVKGIYSSGDKTQSDGKGTAGIPYDLNSKNYNSFLAPGNNSVNGASYYWAEIMGDGVFDNMTPAGTTGDKITNMIIANLGSTYQLLPDLKFAADLYYAQLAEDRNMNPFSKRSANWQSNLGTELDMVITYTLVDNLKLDLVGAYLWSGDVINKAFAYQNAAGQTCYYSSSNPYEFGTQLSLAF
ncbi:MAG: hypothetical protein M0Z56_10860 [Desulfobacteraceae bacterium]|nr:hypothetical protein [Desulfobacteraceae bacterium]